MSRAICLLFLFSVADVLAQGDSAAFTYVLPVPGRYINDHSLVYANGEWHLFTTDGESWIRPWMSPGNEVRIGHATSPDLIRWTLREPVLGLGDSGALDAAHVYAPNVVRDGSGWRMFYTGNERGFFSGEHVLSARSVDLVNWTRDPAPPFVPDSAWARWYPRGYDSGVGGPVSFRDPFILAHPTAGYLCYYVARLRKASPDAPDTACIAVATSRDLNTWIDRGPVLVRPVLDDDGAWAHPESPCAIVRDGRTYLFWKGRSGTSYASSADPLNFHAAQERTLASSHASKIIEWNGEWYITSCSRDVNDTTHTLSDRTRGLYLAGLQWNGDRPVVVPLPATLGSAVNRRTRPMDLW